MRQYLRGPDMNERLHSNSSLNPTSCVELSSTWWNIGSGSSSLLCSVSLSW